MSARSSTRSAVAPKPVQRPTAPKATRDAVQTQQFGEVPESVGSVLRTPGSPLPADVRRPFEAAFSHDFSRVRVHTGPDAAASARDVQALAYTVGPRIVFGEARYQPATSEGRALLAHELAHSAQQDTGGAIPSRLQTGSEGEEDARSAEQAVSVLPAPGPLKFGNRTGIRIARKESPEAAAARRFEERVKRIDELLSYGLFDWAITDAEATEALRLLQMMSPPERTRALKRIRVDRLINNVPDKLQPEIASIIAQAGGQAMVKTEVVKILTYDFFDWIGNVSKAEAKQALGLLEALPEDQRDRTLDDIPREKRKRLHDALPEKGRARFLEMWDQKENRIMERAIEEMRPLKRGERFLLRVTLKKGGESIIADEPNGTPVEIDEAGDVYYPPLDKWISIAGRKRSEAEAALTEGLTLKADVDVIAKLNPVPKGREDLFAGTKPLTREAFLKKQALEKEAQEKKKLAEQTPDPMFEKQQEFRYFIVHVGKAIPKFDSERFRKDEKYRKDMEMEHEAFRRFTDWFDKNVDSPKLLKLNPGTVYGKIRGEVTGAIIKRDVAREIELKKIERANSPEVAQARMKKMDEFLNLALRLKGESSRRFPYSIPVDSEGVDILVTGDPARQAVLDQIADELMGWSREHMMDDNYTSVNPKSILLYILNSGYGKMLDAANFFPLEHEVIDRHEIIPDTALGAFAKTVATGLAAIAVVGAAVGLGIISGGTAFIILGGLAAYGGVTSYIQRRKEIEKKGYDVPVAITAVHAAGDAIGVSQLVEGITGERLGINEQLSSVDRSNKFGEGTAGVVLLLTGSRAYRYGQGVGQTLRLSAPPSVPPTLEGVPVKQLEGQYPKGGAPEKPVQNPNPGKIEAAARADLPERLRVGFDRWVESMRSNPTKKVDIEKVLGRMSKDQIEKISTKPAEDYYAQVAEAERIAGAKARSQGDPLRPNLAHKEWRDGVSVHYEKTPPDPVEINHAREIQNRTGEPVKVFGDTPANKSYPGIDGTIGEPPRPMQLKDVHGPEWLKVHAHDAFEAASKFGYNKVEVHLRIPESTVAECKAAWEGKPGHPRGETVGWETKLSMQRNKMPLAKLVIEAKDGVWEVPAPPASPAPPGVKMPGGDDKKDEKKK